ncbi:hypothetical protein B11527_13290 [Campylobacter jejuni]|nr:hypothetical protein B11527_13290 [Campylobacter jejuni]
MQVVCLTLVIILYLLNLLREYYYFSYTPSHTENGAIAKDIDSMKNNSVSIEVGAEFRKYMNENSYIFVTPKIEQFVINSGDDYTANLAVNNAFFLV